jgi:hypothetical protein
LVDLINTQPRAYQNQCWMEVFAVRVGNGHEAVFVDVRKITR